MLMINDYNKLISFNQIPGKEDNWLNKQNIVIAYIRYASF